MTLFGRRASPPEGFYDEEPAGKEQNPPGSLRLPSPSVGMLQAAGLGGVHLADCKSVARMGANAANTKISVLHVHLSISVSVSMYV